LQITIAAQVDARTFEVQHSGTYERPHPFSYYMTLSLNHTTIASYDWHFMPSKWEIKRFNSGDWLLEFDKWYEQTKIEKEQDDIDRFALLGE